MKIQEVTESCDGFISFDKLNDLFINKFSLLFALKTIKEHLCNSTEEIQLKKICKIKSSPEIIKSVSSFSTLTNL